MIVQEYYGENSLGNLYRTYSDINKMILQVETGIEYSEAIDTEENFRHKYTYIETDKDIIEEVDENSEKTEKIEA